jgi:hypothetical protein
MPPDVGAGTAVAFHWYGVALRVVPEQPHAARIPSLRYQWHGGDLEALVVTLVAVGS